MVAAALGSLERTASSEPTSAAATTATAAATRADRPRSPAGARVTVGSSRVPGAAAGRDRMSASSACAAVECGETCSSARSSGRARRRTSSTSSVSVIVKPLVRLAPHCPSVRRQAMVSPALAPAGDERDAAARVPLPGCNRAPCRPAPAPDRPTRPGAGSPGPRHRGRPRPRAHAATLVRRRARTVAVPAAEQEPGAPA